MQAMDFLLDSGVRRACVEVRRAVPALAVRYDAQVRPARLHIGRLSLPAALKNWAMGPLADFPSR